MKKILMSILIVLLLISNYFLIWHGIKLFNVKSIQEIKQASQEVTDKLYNANELNNQTYPNEYKELEDAIESLKKSKQEYENKTKYNSEGEKVGALEVKTYKIHYLWAILGNYKKEENLKSLNLDLKTTKTKDVYDLQITLVGSYIGITDFLYDIEDDEQLNFEVKNLSIQPYTTTTTITTTIDGYTKNKKTTKINPFSFIFQITSSALENSTNNTKNTQNNSSNNNTAANTTTNSANNNNSTTVYDPKWVEATFKVENIGITLD